MKSPACTDVHPNKCSIFCQIHSCCIIFFLLFLFGIIALSFLFFALMINSCFSRLLLLWDWGTNCGKLPTDGTAISELQGIGNCSWEKTGDHRRLVELEPEIIPTIPEVLRIYSCNSDWCCKDHYIHFHDLSTWTFTLRIRWRGSQSGNWTVWLCNKGDTSFSFVYFFAWTMKVKKPISSQLNSVPKHT